MILSKQELCEAYQKLLIDSLPTENTEEAYQEFFFIASWILYEILDYIKEQQ